MKKLFIFFLTVSYASFLTAQACMPNDTVTTLVHPVPFNSNNPDGGINKIACKGEPFDFLFTVNVPTEFVYQNNQLPLDSARMATSDAIINLPEGLTYACNPGNCTFLPNSQGCALISGTVASTVPAGNYNLSLSFNAYLNIFGQNFEVPYTYPDLDTTATEDRYTLQVRESNSPACVTGLFSAPLEAGKMRIAPNPVQEMAYVLTDLKKGGSYQVQIVNSMGQIVFNNTQQLVRGDNLLEIPVSSWASGVYFIRMIQGNAQVQQTFVIE